MMDLLELRTKSLTVKMKLFDAHCHLQDKRVIDEASQLISAAFSCRCYQFRSQWKLRERLGLGERDGRDVSFCCTLHRTTSLNLLIPLYLATKLQEMKTSAERLPMLFIILTTGAITALCVSLLGSLLAQPTNSSTSEKHNSCWCACRCNSHFSWILHSCPRWLSVGTLMAFTVVAACVLVLRYVPPDGVPLSSHWSSRFN
ncbi:hypothetical protein ISN45_Aa03g003920 [Arabidopsis thaliana x Arabidopsis arenosa]|uniref:Transmembrane protein n=1 Tax=Arabidopsis thaliana x Arabidopsis arenosa TaxID=1240361 RepID=A0A8T2AS32_9BRAS|nr:hypothetical protein ISN45_Aa03g003920 [Arabidopsis thaliana x Arabidopsis arenosa]